MNRLAALVPNVPGTAPGQRVRIESWVPFLERSGWAVELYPFEDATLREVLYQPGHQAAKASRLLASYRKQLQRVLALPPCEVVVIYREAALIGPAFLERLVARRNVPVVFDLDEPIFLPYRSPTSGWASLLKVSRKTHTLFRLATEVMAINRLIGDYARRYNSAVTVVPNFVDVKRYTPGERRADGVVRLGWSGSHSTMANLRQIHPVLWRLQHDNPVRLRVVGAGRVDLPGIDVEERQWSAETEVRDIQDCDIGLVPLVDTRWNRWKFFMKVVQYMAVGLPVVAQRMGSNSEVIQHGVNGFLVDTQEDWYRSLTTLVRDPDLRRRMGAAARRTAVEHFSVEANADRVLSVFERAARGRPAPGPSTSVHPVRG